VVGVFLLHGTLHQSTRTAFVLLATRTLSAAPVLYTLLGMGVCVFLNSFLTSDSCVAPSHHRNKNVKRLVERLVYCYVGWVVVRLVTARVEHRICILLSYVVVLSPVCYAWILLSLLGCSSTASCLPVYICICWLMPAYVLVSLMWL